MRNIGEGEQLCLDYAMIDDYEGSMECKCGLTNCRETINGKDWKIANLQLKYHGFFSAFLEKKISAQ